MPKISLQNINIISIVPLMAKWMNDPEVVKYTHHTAGEATAGKELQFIEDCQNNGDLLMAIMLDSVPIGTILVSNYHPVNKTATVSIMIGEKQHWGKGCATEAVKLMVDLTFTTTDINRIEVGMAAENPGSVAVFEKNGFASEWTETEKVFCCGRFMDAYKMRLLKKEWESEQNGN